MYVEEGVEEISQEDCWDVIKAFFEEKGLVRQQIDSFNEFMSNTVQELVEESKSLTLEQAEQHTGNAEDKTRRYEIEFGQIYMNKPRQTEADGSTAPLFPQEARQRNLTYSAGLHVDVSQKVLIKGEEDELDENGDQLWIPDPSQEEIVDEKVYLG